MNISEYRDQFAAFNSSLELARYQYHVGLTAKVNCEEIFDRYSDLFSLAALVELRTSLEQTPADFKTERTALRTLLSAGRLRQAEMRADEATRELARCEAGNQIEWNNQTLSLEDVPALLGGESKKTKRQELATRWIDSISVCDELRAARVASLNESARLLGSASYGELIFDATNTDSNRMDQAARSLLDQTESTYKSALAKLVGREFPELRLSKLDFGDLPCLEAAAWLDRYLPGKNLFRTRAKTLSGLGIRMDQQPNILIDAEPRASRKPSAACFPVRAPEDVRLAVLPHGGAANFLDGLQQLGRAQHYAWCSKNLARLHPEFIYSPDSATADGFGYLFKYFSLDPKWILEFLPEVEAVRAGEIAKDVTFQLTLELRRLCAAVLYQACAYNEGQSHEQLQSTYVALYERATSLSMRPESFLLNLQKALQPGSQLRALAFSFGLREYLRVRYGYRWWNSRKAGDDLIDVWNTASRHTVEELASLIGFGELSFDPLAEVITSVLTGAR